MFSDMMNQIRRDIVRHIFHLNIERFDEHLFEARRQRELDELNLVSGDAESGEQNQTQRDSEKLGEMIRVHARSGKKYKKCHGK